MATKPDLPKWIPSNDPTKISDPGTTKRAGGWLYKEKPARQFLNWFYNLVSNWFLGLQGGVYDIVIGSAAQVTNNEATHEIDDLDDALAVAGSRVLILDGTHALTGNLNLSNVDLKITSESPLAILDVATFTATFSGARNDIKLRVTNSGTDDIIVSGAGSMFEGIDVPIDNVAVSNGANARTSGAAGGMKTFKYYENGIDVINEDELVAAYFVVKSELAASNWEEQSNPKNLNLVGIDWDGDTNNQFVAVGEDDGIDAYIVTSPDGKVWTERTNPKDFALNDVIWNSSKYVAVGFADGADAYLITSPDGIIWTEQSNPKNFNLFSVAWSGSVFCAVGEADGADAYIVTSPDGITWNERSNPKNVSLNDVIWDATNSLFIAVGAVDGADAYLITSPDGIIWTEQSNPKNFGLNGIETSGSIIVAVGFDDGTDTYIITSTDGITWTERTAPENRLANKLNWNGGVFCAVGLSTGGLDAYLITSHDGITWTRHRNPKDFTIFDIASNDHYFVAVGGKDGTDAYLSKSLNYN